MRVLIIMVGLALLGMACSSPKNKEGKVAASNNNPTAVATANTSQKDLKDLSKAYFASGCFWCVEAIFESVKGVEEAVSGYAGGKEPNPTYQQVSAGATSHAEAVEVYYDPEVVDYETLVKVYYGSHDPTTVNGQAPDFGTQYRSMILYTNEEEKTIAEKYKQDLEASGQYSQPIATEIEPLTTFWKAEEYHQDFERRNPNQSYIKNVSIPRLNRFKKKFPALLKEEAQH